MRVKVRMPRRDDADWEGYGRVRDILADACVCRGESALVNSKFAVKHSALGGS